MYANQASGFHVSNPKTTLFVGNLHPLVTETMIYVAFSDMGQILSIHIPRDVASQSSLGYALVTFRTRQDAERVLESLIYEDLMGRELRITWYEKIPIEEQSGRDFILVHNLDETINQFHLYELFSRFGKIVTCKVAMDEQGRSKGCGCIHFEDEICAKNAIDAVDGGTINGRVVYVEPLIPSIQCMATGGESGFTTVLVKNLKVYWTDEYLKALFEPFGKIRNVRVMRYKNSTSKGFGFVCFAHPRHAQEAVKRMHCKNIDGQRLHVIRALSQQSQECHGKDLANSRTSVTVYVGNLDECVDDAQLREFFDKFGEITHAKVMNDAKGTSKGFGFVRFTSPTEARNAVKLNGYMLGSKPLRVALALAHQQS